MVGLSRAQRVKTAARRAQAIDLRISGVDWETIATRLGYSDRAAACKDVSRALEANRRAAEAGAEDLRTLELARLDALLVKAWAVLERHHVAHSGGKIVTMVVNGEEIQLRDDAPTLNAIDRVLKIMERRARYVPIEVPQKIEQGGQVRYIIDGVDLSALT